MAQPLKLRVFYETKSGEPVDIKSVTEWIRGISPTHFVVRHEADADDSRPHIHAILWTTRTAQQLRDAIRKAVPSTKRQYSIGEVTNTAEDIATYERYMCHGSRANDKVHIVSASASAAHPTKYTQEWANSQNVLFHQFRHEMSRKKTQTILAMVIEACVAADHRDPRSIVKTVMSVYNRENRVFNTFHMKAVTRAAIYQLSGQQERVRLEDEILRGLDFFS